MKSLHSRREIINSLSGTLLVAGASWPAFSSAAARPTLRAEGVAANVLLIRGAGANVLALRDANGLLFVDGGLKTHAPAVLKLAQRELGAQQAHTLINTHWHAEHTGLNERLGKHGVKIIAHENTRLWLSTTVRYQPDGPPIRPLPAFARPNLTTYTTGELAVGDDTLRYGYLPQAHTDGDLYVRLSRADRAVRRAHARGHGQCRTTVHARRPAGRTGYSGEAG
jgi:glyoxylase-like metal-dependent hydrolase (beta-lactamase superfamily II)